MTRLSSAILTVTVCALFQLFVVNDRVLTLNDIAPVDSVIVTVTVALGLEESLTEKVVV